jgi:hypothetical protein
VSVAGVVAGTASVVGAPLLEGSPPVRTLGAGAVLDGERTSFQNAFDIAGPRIRRRESSAGPAPLAPGTAWTARSVTSSDSAAPGRVTLAGTSRHDGLLVIDGDLLLQGALLVNGLLVVSGALDASAGTLEVDGGVIVRDAATRGTRLGANVRIRYSPCLVGRALATVARPRIAPFALWIAR